MFFSCASLKRPEVENQSIYSENTVQFIETELDNGIPVIIKNIPSEKNIEVRLLFDGGASVCPTDKSGIYSLAFDLLAENPRVKKLSSYGKYFPVNGTGNDSAYYGMSAAASDFDEGLEAFAASFIEPEYSHSDYLLLESQSAGRALDRQESPKYLLLDAVSRTMFDGSPYSNGIYYETSSRISEYDIEKFLKKIQNAAEMKILVAGNLTFSDGELKRRVKKEKLTEEDILTERSAVLREKLQRLFGGIDYDETLRPRIPEISFRGKKDILVKSEFAGGEYYSALCFKAPVRGSEDYEAFAVSTMVLDGMLKHDFVEPQPSVSFCGTAVLNGKQSAVLVISGGKSEGEAIHKAVSDSLDLFPEENDLSSRLDMFKNIYISKIAASTHNAEATLDQITSSIVYEGGPKKYLDRIEKIRGLTAADVITAYKKYFVAADSFGVLVTK